MAGPPNVTVLPAYAGMIPGGTAGAIPICRAPRLRGDDPLAVATSRHGSSVLPAYAGMIPGADLAASVDDRAPRLRGDDPEEHAEFLNALVCSPPTRG